jgi:hypothetical protein
VALGKLAEGEELGSNLLRVAQSSPWGPGGSSRPRRLLWSNHHGQTEKSAEADAACGAREPALLQRWTAASSGSFPASPAFQRGLRLQICVSRGGRWRSAAAYPVAHDVEPTKGGV